MIVTDWKKIASHLYDELRVHGISECVFNHKGLCGSDVNDCIKDFERADETDG